MRWHNHRDGGSARVGARGGDAQASGPREASVKQAFDIRCLENRSVIDFVEHSSDLGGSGVYFRCHLKVLLGQKMHEEQR